MAAAPSSNHNNINSNDVGGEPLAPSSSLSSTSRNNNNSSSSSSAQMILCWQQNPEDTNASRCTVPSSGQPAIVQQAVINANNYFGILPHPFQSTSSSSTTSSSSLPKAVAPSYATSLQQHAPTIATSNMYQAVTAGSDPYGSLQQAHLGQVMSSQQSKGYQAPAPAPVSNQNVSMMMMMSNSNNTLQQQQQQQQQLSGLPFAFDTATTNNLLQMSLQDPNMFANLLLWKALQDANNGAAPEQQQQQQQQQHAPHQQQQPQHHQQIPQQLQNSQHLQVQQPQQQAQRQQQLQLQQSQQQQLQQQQELQQLQLQQQQIQQQLLQSYALATGSQATQPAQHVAMTQQTPQNQSQFSSSNVYQTVGSNSEVASSNHAFHTYSIGSSTAQATSVPFQSYSSNQQAMAQAPSAATANTQQLSDRQDDNTPSTNKKLFALQTFVKPVSRDGNNDSPLNDDLWKLFTGDYDEDSPDEALSSEPSKPAPSYTTPTLSPLVPLGGGSSSLPMTTSATAEVSVNLEPIVSAPSWLAPQQQQQQQQQQQHQQQQQTLHHPPTPILSSVSAPTVSNKPFLSAQQEAAAADQYMMVPPTLFPPTLLGSNTHPSSRASPSPGGSSHQNRGKGAAAKSAGGKVKAAGCGRYRKDGTKASASTATPYEHLKSILVERGFTIPKTKSSEAGYVTTPSPLQLASFGTKLVKAVHASDPQLLSSLLECGLSPNPCNQFRDSILDLVCKRANEPIFQCMLEHNADLQVCDGFGRTPLHHAAWASTFSPVIAHAILKRDPVQAFLEDNRGQTPLEYVRPSLFTQWIAFLDEHKDEFWPMGGDAAMVTSNPPKRRDLQLADPPNALSVDLAGLVSSGVVDPPQVAAMDELTRRTYQLDQYR